MTAQTLPETVAAPRPAPPSIRPRRRLAPGKPLPYGRLLGPLLLLGLWALASAAAWLDPRLVSAPWTVVQTAGELLANGQLSEHLGASVQRALSGFVIGGLVGVVLAVIAGLSRIGAALIDGPVQIKRAIPTIALAPLLILLLGINESFKVVLIAAGVATSIYVPFHAALVGIDNRYVELAEVQNYRRREFLRHVVFPGALPGLFVGLRLSVTVSWLLLATVEQINALSGIGYMMGQAQLYAQTDIILLGLALYAILGFTSDTVVRLVERRVLAWRRTLNS
ncbi:ABC transporter permease [Jidongwangia harbinensis]|uniref:ABC transporter permease n=1 Tax=Jidongwangia harbinensis TaxID=2878561 RepID=UPI001CD93750|nr:ABC transporter permease [Jidongwangia harbinensis]MCA2217384.1 ABC transporter permease [Jidongwangia harbinensis]